MILIGVGVAFLLFAVFRLIRWRRSVDSYERTLRETSYRPPAWLRGWVASEWNRWVSAALGAIIGTSFIVAGVMSLS